MLDASWISLITFVALVLSVSLYGLAVSGHFPGEHRAESLRTRPGAALLWGTMVVAGAAGISAIAFAAATLPWFAAIIGGGAALLAAPLLLQPFPDRFVNGRQALVAFAGLAVLLSGLAWTIG